MCWCAEICSLDVEVSVVIRKEMESTLEMEGERIATEEELRPAEPRTKENGNWSIYYYKWSHK